MSEIDKTTNNINKYPAEQYEYINLLRDVLQEKYNRTPLATVITYGCQQNVSDSERIKGMLFKMGFDFTDDEEKSDFILFNTCAVREHAEDRVFGNVGALKHYKRRNPDLIIGVCGCMAQQQTVNERMKQSYPYVDLLFGTHVTYRLPEFLYKLFTKKERVFETSVENSEIIEDVPIKRDGTFKGWLPIMYGCNNFCTYCIVPYVRGRERSRDFSQILNEAEQMVNDGFKDITLLGQNVNSYHSPQKDYDGSDVDFPQLLRKLNAIPGDFRIRFMTSHPKDCSLDLLYAMRECDKVCKHLHLPFQSGSTEILRRMNRRYTREKYLELVKNAYSIVPGIALTSDIIVGFPGETYEDFCETLSMVNEVKFTALFTFIFSARNGTPAAAMEDPVSREEKGKWFRELLKAQEKISKENEKNLCGKKFRVLCDGLGRKEGTLTGHTDTNVCLEFLGDKSLIGSFAEVETSYVNGEVNAVLVKEK